MGADPKEQPIPTVGDSSSRPFQQPVDTNAIHMQQTQQGLPPPAYMPSPTAAPISPQPQFQQPQFQQAQFAQPQPQYQFVQLPDGTMQAVPVVQSMYSQPMPQQPIVMMSPAAQPAPAKEQPTIIVNNASAASASAANASGGTTGACLAGCGGACAACLCCTVM
jgi:hypothetical protein